MKNQKQKLVQKLAKLGGVPRVDTSKVSKFFKPEEMPAVDHTPLGRHRLVQALRNKFGETFRNKPGVSDAIRDFDEQSSFIKKAIKLGVE